MPLPAFLARLLHAAPVRLLLIGFPVLMAFGLTMAFHFEYRKGRLPFAYTVALDWLITLAMVAGLALLYVGLVRKLERRWPQELDLRPGGRWLLLGLALGFGLFATVCAVFTLLGVASWHGLDLQAPVGPFLLLSIVAGVGEEILFRGVLFRIVEDSIGTAGAVVVSAAFFGLAHAGNPNASALSSVAIALEAGVMLAVAYAWSRNLWLVIGLHAAWNFTEGGIFSAAVSGHSEPGLVRMVLSPTPEWLTGGAFGPEGSVVALGVCVAAAAVFTRLALRDGQWRRRQLRLVLA